MSDRAEIVEVMARAIEGTNVNFSLRLVRLVDGESTYELQFADEEPLSFSSNEEAYEVLAERKRHAQAESALAALEASGMAVVPREPTEAMLEAGEEADAMYYEGRTQTAQIYKAMLAAALPSSKE